AGIDQVPEMDRERQVLARVQYFDRFPQLRQRLPILALSGGRLVAVLHVRKHRKGELRRRLLPRCQTGREQQEAQRSHHTAKPSTTLAADSVGTTRLRRNPALASKSAYSGSVRSCPPGPTSIIMSSILPGCGALPGGSTISLSSTRAPGFIARRTLPRIVRHCGSLQS